MYKSRFKIWIIVAVAFLLVTVFGQKAKDAFVTYWENRPQYPDVVTVQVTDTQLRRNLNGKDVGHSEASITSTNGDVIISEDITEQDGYLSKTFYSPIVAILSSSEADGVFRNIGGSNRTIKIMNLKEVMNGFMTDQKFKDCYTSSGSGSLSKVVPAICVDTNYETEIKLAMVMAMTGKCNITQADVDKHIDYVNQVWNKAEKITDIDTLLANGIKQKIVLTAEYKIGINYSNLAPVSLVNTTAVKFNIQYKDGFEYFVDSEEFMEMLGIRKEGVTSFYNGSLFNHTDWTIQYLYNDAFDFDLTVKGAPAESADAPKQEENTSSSTYSVSEQNVQINNEVVNGIISNSTNISLSNENGVSTNYNFNSNIEDKIYQKTSDELENLSDTIDKAFGMAEEKVEETLDSIENAEDIEKSEKSETAEEEVADEETEEEESVGSKILHMLGLLVILCFVLCLFKWFLYYYL